MWVSGDFWSESGELNGVVHTRATISRQKMGVLAILTCFFKHTYVDLMAFAVNRAGGKVCRTKQAKARPVAYLGPGPGRLYRPLSTRRAFNPVPFDLCRGSSCARRGGAVRSEGRMNESAYPILASECHPSQRRARTGVPQKSAISNGFNTTWSRVGHCRGKLAVLG